MLITFVLTDILLPRFESFVFFSDDSVSADIKLETETEDGGTCEDIPSNLTPNMYHPRRALRNAINDWLPEFSRAKQAWGPIIKPQPVIPVPIPVPILPSINTCMSLTTTTTTASNSSSVTQTISSSQLVTSTIPFAAHVNPVEATSSNPPNTNQLEALAEVCSTVSLFMQLPYLMHCIFLVFLVNFAIVIVMPIFFMLII